MLSVKQGRITYHVLSLCYDSTPVSQTIGKDSNHYANGLVRVCLILRLPTLRTIASILKEKLLSLFLHLIKCLWNEDEVFFNSDVDGCDCISYVKSIAF